MRERIFQIEFAGHAVRCRFLLPTTRLHFGTLARPVEGNEYDVYVTPERLAKARETMPADYSNNYVEYRTLTELSSHVLIRFGCCFFHAVSFCWRERAWLLTAPSGTGKTTQFLNWQRLHPGEITMICGDMPVLEQRDDGTVWVHPSPWNGKEDLGDRNHPPMPLAGIVLLKRGPENAISRLSAADAIPTLFSQFILLPDTADEILGLASLTDAVLRTAPVWELTNRGDDASTELLRQTLEGGSHDSI